MEAFERYEKDFTEKHFLKKTDMTEDIEHREGMNVISDEGVLVEWGESADPDGAADLGGMTEIYMMGAAGPRKKANRSAPIPDDSGERVEVPRETEQPGGPTSRKETTGVPMDQARALHERLKRASHKKVEHDLGDAVEGDILETRQLAAAWRS
ncbi:unnamed protein product, partial [Prorocentrum cordatum]